MRQNVRIAPETGVDEAAAGQQRLIESLLRSPMHIAMFRGPSHLYAFANESYRAGAGFAFDPIGKPFGLATSNAAEERVRAVLDRVFSTGETVTGEIHLPRAHGDGTFEDQWFNVVAQPTRDASGAIDGVAIHAIAVTEQVRARIALEALNEQIVRQREALRTSEARLRRVVDSNMCGLMFWDQSGAVTDANDELLKIIGYSRDDLNAGRVDWLAMTPKEHADVERRAHEELAERGVCTPFEKEYIRKDGTRVPILIGGALFADNPRGGVAFVLDISERKRQEAALREARENLRTVLQGAPLVLLAIDREGRITMSEGREVEALGLVAGENVGKSLFEVHGDNPAVVAAARAALAGGSPSGILPFRGQFFEARLQPQRDAAGAIIGAIGVATNVTERLRAEQAREQMHAQMLQTQKLESLGVLAGGVAHDFNNLLAGILGNASIALLDMKESPDAQRAVEDIVAAARRAAALVRQLLTYSGKAPRQTQPLRLGGMVKELVALLHASIPKKVRIDLELPDALPTIEADAGQLQQVVMNLVINGAEAIGDRAGTVTVRAGTAQLDETAAARLLTSEKLASGSYVFLEVADDGEGMSESTRAKIFDPFFTTKSAGRGLGLAAVVGIMRVHGGAIRLDTVPGRGTTFRLYFPVSGKPAPDSSRSRRALRPDAFRNRGTVLVVDDEAQVRMAARRILEWFGLAVVEATGGRSGVALFRDSVKRGEPFALVLLDMTMPDMGGQDVFRELRAIRSDARVVLTSGYAEVDALERFRLDGIAGFLEKPYTAEQLADVLEKALAR